MLRRRGTAVLAIGLAGVAVLAGCRTSPNVAAYVGDAEVTVAELDVAVDERLADPAIAAYATDGRTAYARRVLSLEVVEEVYAAAARRYDVDVSAEDARDRIGELLAGNDPAAVFDQLARQQGVSEDDVVETVRQQIILQRIAETTGRVDLSDAALRELYEQSRDQLGQVELGLVTVPDQATADSVLAALTADPARYPELAAQYAGDFTLPEIQPRSADQFPPVLAELIAATPPGQGFTVPVAETGGVVVGFVRGIAYPSFAEVRDQLAQQAAAAAEEIGATLVDGVRSDLDVTVNPRYGVLEDGQVVRSDGGVVQLLEDAGDAAAGAGGD